MPRWSPAPWRRHSRRGYAASGVRARATRRGSASPGLPRPAAVALVPLLAAASLVLAPAGPAAAYPSPNVDVAGRGWGHGRGMGQYGALGYAVDHGWDHARILDHFYGGTTRSHQPDGAISVHLTRFDDRDLIVRSANAFRVGTNDVPAGTAARVQRLSDGRWRIFRGPGCGGPWSLAQEVGADARPEATTTYTGDDRSRMLNVCDGATTAPYRGSLMVRADGGRTRVGNIVAMERYLRGVVPRESPASWADVGGGRGFQQLKAQAVAARSYAWAESRSPYKTCDTISCQVYGGAAGEDPRSTRAVDETAGEVRRWPNGTIARTEFSSSTGGWTAGGEFAAVVDEGDDIAANPNHRWTTSIPAAEVGSRFGVGDLVSIQVLRRNGLGADGGRVLEVRVVGSTGSRTVTGLSFRSTLGLKSDWFTVAPTWPFADIAGNVHASSIAALADAGITKGCSTTSYCPHEPVSRAQLATLLDRALDLPDTGVDHFGDDDGSVHEAAINRVAAAGIVSGTAEGTFSPTATVRRDQTATMLARGFDVPGSTVSPFTDINPRSPHLPAIRAAAAAGITNGCSATRFCPGAPVSRDQAASFLARTLDLV